MHTSVSTEQRGAGLVQQSAHTFRQAEKLSAVFEAHKPALQSDRGFLKVSDATQLMAVGKMQKSVFRFALGVTCIKKLFLCFVLCM